MTEYLIPISIVSFEEGGYLATSSQLQGLIAQGRTVAETIEIDEDVAQKIIESQIEHNEPISESLISVQTVDFKFDTKIPIPLEV